MGHSSIQITADVYGHLVPGANVSWVDSLDSKSSQQLNATPAQPTREEFSEAIQKCSEGIDGMEVNGERDGDRTHDHLIKSPIQHSQNQQLQELRSEESGKPRQSTQPPRNQKLPAGDEE
jgi:hypothetical protein